MIEFKYTNQKFAMDKTTATGFYYIGHFADVKEQDIDGNDIIVNKFIRVNRLKEFNHTFKGGLSRADIDSHMRIKLLEKGNSKGRTPIPQQTIE